MISALEAHELNKNTLLLMEFFDGAPLFKEKFDRLPSYISQSYIYVAEMICLWEASFPASENYFQLHQIMDLVSSIPLFGSTHSWSDLLGEKALGSLKKIKKKSNPGGLSYEKNIIRRHVDREISTLNKFYSDSVNFTDKTAPNYKTKVWFDDEHDIIKFNAAQFAIQKPEKNAANLSFNKWEINILVEVLLREIRKRYDGDEAQCIENSYLYSAICHVGKRFPRQTHSQLLNTIVDNDDCCPREEVLVAQSLLSFKPMFHSQAWIYGLQFRSRGSMYREYLFELPQKVRANSETYSAREVPWNCKKNYSSWCMFQQSDFNSLNTPHSYRYGRINSFFAINIGDKSIDGLLLASVTSHKFERVAINVDKVTNSESLDPHTIFIALQDIYPTLIATIPFASNGLATRTSRKQNVDPKHVNALEKNLQLMYSIMLKMNPDKLSCFPSKRPWTIYLSKENGRLPTTTVANTPLHANSEHSKLNHKCFPLERCSSRPTGGVFYSSSSYWTNQKRSSSTEDELLQSFHTSIEENENLRTCRPQAMNSITSSSAMTSSLTGDELMKTSFAPPTNAKRPFLSMISAKPTSSYGYESSNFRGTSNTSSSAIYSSSAMNHTTSNGNESSNLDWTSNTSSSNSIIDISDDSEVDNDSNPNSPSNSIIVISDESDLDADGILPSLRNIELSEAQRENIMHIMQRPHTDAAVEIVEKFGIPMTVGKIQCLKPTVWLNDEVINFYIEMMSERVKSKGVYCFSSFFMIKLLDKDKFTYKRVSRWPKKAKVNVCELKKIFIPIHVPGHWAVVFIDVLNKEIYYYDSLQGDGKLYTSSALKVFTHY